MLSQPHLHLSDTSECSSASLSTCAEMVVQKQPRNPLECNNSEVCVLPHFPAFPPSFKFLSPPGLRGHSLLTCTLTLDYFPFLTPPNKPFLSNPCLWVFSWEEADEARLPCWIYGKMWLRIWPALYTLELLTHPFL